MSRLDAALPGLYRSSLSFALLPVSPLVSLSPKGTQAKKGGGDEAGAVDLSACSWPDGPAGGGGEDGLAGVSGEKLFIQKRTICLRQVGTSAGEALFPAELGTRDLSEADVLESAFISKLFTEYYMEQMRNWR